MKNIYFILAVLIAFSAASQDQHCATDRVMKAVYDKNPALRIKKQKQDEAQRSNTALKPASATYVIPIVFHILHLDGPENISDDQVKDGLRILNRDFAKQNPDLSEVIPAFQGLADSTRIQFELPTKDPMGNCTNGIIHHYDTDTDWDELSPTLYSHTWDPTRYMNVYLVRTITLSSGFGAAGYTYFPGTFLPGDNMDAIVVLNNYFGSIGTGSNFLSRVLTHEVGHWLDLYHVFGGTNSAGVDCTGDDYVTDTPVTLGYLNCPNPAVPAQYQNCTPGISENFQNYMDYSYCCRMFTTGQAVRMQQALQNPISGRDNLWSNANLIVTGVINPSGPCTPVADFTYNRAKTCVNTPVQFKDASWNGTPTSYTWTFSGGTPATSTASAPVVSYANPGKYSVTLSTGNASGNSVAKTKNMIIDVTAMTAAYNNFWLEGFENLATVNNDWTIFTSSGAAKWEQSNDAAYAGFYSAKLDAANNTRKTVTSMVSPAVNMGSNPGPTLSFRLAAAEVTPNHINTLKVYTSTDCGSTWNQVYSKTGQPLVTSPFTGSNFTPVMSDWRQEVVSLNQLIAEPYVSFKFEYTRDTIPAASHIYIDNINLGGPVALSEHSAITVQNMKLFPVPSEGAVNVQFNLVKSQHVKMGLYDVSGRLLEVILDKELETGTYTETLNKEKQLGTGIYFLRLQTATEQITGKIIVGP